MATDGDKLAFVFKKIDELPIGFEGGLAAMCGDEWGSIGEPWERREFGKQFKDLVITGKLPCLEWVEIAVSGRHDVYRKIKSIE